MRIVQLINDNREIQRKYHLDDPVFGPAPEALLEGFKALGSEVEVHVVSCLQQMPRRSPAKLAENIFYHPLHVPKIGWLRTGYQACIRATRRKTRELQPDIVHGQGTERDCAMCAVFSGFSNVLTIHGHMSRIAELTRSTPLTYYWLAEKLERLCLRRTDGVVCLTNYTSRIVATCAKPTWIIPNAVHPSFFEIVRSPSPLPHLLCLANVHPWKNQVGLIKAMDRLRAAHDFNLTFAGANNPEDPYFREFSRTVAARPWCEYLGPLGRDRLKNEMSRASLCILPSFEDNCPMVILEAMAAGVPVVASAIGGIPELIDHGQAGLLFDPDDPSDIAAKVAEILGAPARAEKMAKLARSRCRDKSSGKKVASLHVQIYRKVVDAAQTADRR